MLVMFGVFVVTDLAAQQVHVAGLTGFGFAAGSAIAAGTARRDGLLLVATTPPAMFLAAVTCVELIGEHTNHFSVSPARVAASVFLTLTAAAPWLLIGLAGMLIIAGARGLPGYVREQRAAAASERSVLALSRLGHTSPGQRGRSHLGLAQLVREGERH